VNSIVDNSERNIRYEYAFPQRPPLDLNKSKASSRDIFCKTWFFYYIVERRCESISIYFCMKLDLILIVFLNFPSI
jgi:hypothetical protein